jgi:hypothetical protein
VSHKETSETEVKLLLHTGRTTSESLASGSSLLRLVQHWCGRETMKSDRFGFYSLAIMLLSLWLIALAPSNVLAMEKAVGQFTVVKGEVTVVHAAAPHARQQVEPQAPVLFYDSVQTESNARTKALFVDDTLLTVGENTRIKIDEYVFNPHEDQRSVIVNMFQGRIRALVGKHFTGAGSRFEIRTPTAVAAARGTYFIVWIENNGTTGMANIGEKGDVAFTAAGRMVVVKPGYYSMATDGAAPTTPVVFTGQTADISRIVAATDVKENLQTVSAKAVLQAVGHELIPVSAFATIPTSALSTTVIASTSSLAAGTSSSITGVVSTGTSAVTSVMTSAAQTVTSLAPTSAATATMAAITSTGAIVAPVVTTIAAPMTPVVTAIAPTVTAIVPVVPVTPPNALSGAPVLSGILH